MQIVVKHLDMCIPVQSQPLLSLAPLPLLLMAFAITITVHFFPSVGTPLEYMLLLVHELASNQGAGSTPHGRLPRLAQSLQLQRLGKSSQNKLDLTQCLFWYMLDVWETRKFKRTPSCNLGNQRGPVLNLSLLQTYGNQRVCQY